MTKPRIIIADTDVDYIIPLQQKFVEEFFGKIELEIITEVSYFNQLFERPQHVDILIISKELYRSSLQRHNITNIFVMSELKEDDVTTNLKVHYVHKYSSVKEIFNEFVSKSANVFRGIAYEKKETQVVVVYSANGGVGKTTMAMGISACLSRNYKNVLYVNTDRLQSFQFMLEDQSVILSNDIYTRLVTMQEDVYKCLKQVIRKEAFSYLPPFKGPIMSLGLQYAIYLQLILSAKESNEYDFIVVDADTTFDGEKVKLLNAADRVVLVTEQTTAALSAMNSLVSNINGIWSEKYFFVCNKFNNAKENIFISPDVSVKFKINEYVEWINEYEHISVEELSENSGMQKVAYWLL